MMVGPGQQGICEATLKEVRHTAMQVWGEEQFRGDNDKVLGVLPPKFCVETAARKPTPLEEMSGW